MVAKILLELQDLAPAADAAVNAAAMAATMAAASITLRSKECQVSLETSPHICTASSMIKTDDQLNSFTGIDSFKTLNAIIEAVSVLNIEWLKTVHCPLPELVMLTMAKLKLNVSFCVLSIFFNCAPNTCSRYFKQTLKVLNNVLGCVITWPEKEKIFKNMPKYF